MNMGFGMSDDEALESMGSDLREANRQIDELKARIKELEATISILQGRGPSMKQRKSVQSSSRLVPEYNKHR